MSARLESLLSEVDVFDRPLGARKIEITSITDDTREVRPGSLFFCVVGAHIDRHNLAAEAVQKGAVAIVVERDVSVNIPQVRVGEVRAAVAPVAAAFYDHPDRHLRIVGITGTNGKTTTAHLLAHILRRHKWKTSTIGTLDGKFTTPFAQDLQRMLAELRDEKNNAVVMEVSSHALVQHRADSIRFAVGVFTNLSQDHLDYHKTMSRYFEAKSLLFEPGRCEKAVINTDDAYGRRLLERQAVPGLPFSLADAGDLFVGPLGSTFNWQGQPIVLPLIGEFNVQNALAAASAARAMGAPPQVISEALADAPAVPGRFEKVDRGQQYTVVVDFAHSPDGLEHALETACRAAQQRDGKVIVVFGCGGDRDREKRPQMGAIAQRLADQVFLTTDNARSEGPAAIADEVLAGMQSRQNVLVELDRKAAIQGAIERANPGDVVLLVGKGHETTQDIGGVKTPFDDRLVAANAIDLRSRTTH